MKSSEKITIGLSIFASFISVGSLYCTGENYEKIDKFLALTFEQLMERGNKYLKEGDYCEGLIYFDRAVEIRPDGPNALRDKGCALVDLGGTRTGSDNNELSAPSEGMTEEIALRSLAILDLT